VEGDQGAGAVPAAVLAAASRLIGFEIQFGPFAVAQLRLIAEMHALIPTGQIPDLRLYVTDTLGNPYVEDEKLAQILQPIARSRRETNAIKRGEPITVVIGNPPYKEKAKGRGGWIEQGSDGRGAPLDRWMPPAEWGVGVHAEHLKNLYVYFWRWATWKVFGTGLHASTGLEETDKAGIVCFISVAGFLNGPGFEKMRDDLRRSCHDIWVIDCSPEGHQPEVATRIFQAVQQPVCIVLAARMLNKSPEEPARVRWHALPEGRYEEKFAALAKLSLASTAWTDCPDGWRDPFLPAASGAWASFPVLKEFFLYDGSGIMPGRTWIIAPDSESLKKRWLRLTAEKDADKKELLFHPHLRNNAPGDKHVRKAISKGLAGQEERLQPVIDDQKTAIEPIRYGFRSFDRQWIIPDARLINQPNPTLWDSLSPRHVYLTAPEYRTPTAGPALTFTGLVPDSHHYNGRGGRVYPLWGDQSATQPKYQAHDADPLGEILWPAGQGRGCDGLHRCGHGTSCLHGALRARSRAARFACSVDSRCDLICGGHRPRPRSGLATLLWRALCRPGGKPTERLPASAKRQSSLHSRRGRHTLSTGASARHAGLRCRKPKTAALESPIPAP